MATTSTIIGGDHTLTWSVPQDVLSAAQQALSTFLQGWPLSGINVDTVSAADPQPMGKATIYNVPGGGNIVAQPGHDAVILTDDQTNSNVTVTGVQDLVIDNNAAKTSITITAPDTVSDGNYGELMGSGTVVAGDGNDTINVLGNASIVAGSGQDSITVQYGTASITVGDSAKSGDAAGNDTISLGGPNDTITAYGSATVSGPGSISATIKGGQLVYQTGSGGESVTAGSGTATLLGGTGVTFIGGTGAVSMVGGGSDTFIGGTGAGSSDTMTGGGGLNVFAFDTGSQPEGGTHVISNFTQSQDLIKLGSSYDLNTILNPAYGEITVTGGNTTLTLDNGQTVIKLIGITNLTRNDFTS
jgi:Ca2+-binding RTX toxin-like protein